MGWFISLKEAEYMGRFTDLKNEYGFDEYDEYDPYEEDYDHQDDEI